VKWGAYAASKDGMRVAYKITVIDVIITRFGDIDLNGNELVKYILKKQDVQTWTERFKG
jgi:hypothetical protein